MVGVAGDMPPINNPSAARRVRLVSYYIRCIAVLNLPLLTRHAAYAALVFDLDFYGNKLQKYVTKERMIING